VVGDRADDPGLGFLSEVVEALERGFAVDEHDALADHELDAVEVGRLGDLERGRDLGLARTGSWLAAGDRDREAAAPLGVLGGGRVASAASASARARRRAIRVTAWCLPAAGGRGGVRGRGRGLRHAIGGDPLEDPADALGELAVRGAVENARYASAASASRSRRSRALPR